MGVSHHGRERSLLFQNTENLAGSPSDCPCPCLTNPIATQIRPLRLAEPGLNPSGWDRLSSLTCSMPRSCSSDALEISPMTLASRRTACRASSVARLTSEPKCDPTAIVSTDFSILRPSQARHTAPARHMFLSCPACHRFIKAISFFCALMMFFASALISGSSPYLSPTSARSTAPW